MSYASSIVQDFKNLFANYNQANWDKLVADINGGIQVGENDLALAAAWVLANLPTYVADAKTLVTVLSALTGQATVPAAVVTTLNSAIAEVSTFLSAVGTVSAAFGVATPVNLASSPAANVQAYKVHQSLVAATAMARLALAK